MIVRTITSFALLVLLAVLLHLLLGWEWTAMAGLAAGGWVPRRGWLAGAFVVAVDYLALVLYSLAMSRPAVVAMTETMGALLGNLPSLAVVALTVLMGALIGALSGAAGTQLRRIALLTRKPTPTT